MAQFGAGSAPWNRLRAAWRIAEHPAGGKGEMDGTEWTRAGRKRQEGPEMEDKQQTSSAAEWG